MVANNGLQNKFKIGLISGNPTPKQKGKLWEKSHISDHHRSQNLIQFHSQNPASVRTILFQEKLEFAQTHHQSLKSKL
jgi:hypothetical protein